MKLRICRMIFTLYSFNAVLDISFGRNHRVRYTVCALERESAGSIELDIPCVP